MKTRYKILSFVILGITVISSAFGATYLIPGLHTDVSYHHDYERDYEFKIIGKQAGAGSHTKSELIFTRTTIDEPLIVDSTELTKDLYHTDNIMFWDWQIHTFEKFVYVSWITSEQTWGDVFLAVSDDYGKTFDVKNISQSRNYVYQYKIDFSDETVYLTWQQGFKTEERRDLQHIYFSKSNDFGESFGEQILLSTFDRFAQEFDLEVFGDNVFVTWREEMDLDDKQNVWFATSTDKAEWFDREPKLLASHVDVDSFNGVLHFTWVSVEDDTEIWYAHSKDLGQTLDSRIVFDADWKLSPYAERPIPKISAGEKTFIEFEMVNEEGEKTHYTIPILDENAKHQEIDLHQNHHAYDLISDPICFVIDRTTSGETGSAVTLGTCIPLETFEEMGCTKPMLEHLLRYSNLLDEELDGMWYLNHVGLPDGIPLEDFDKCVDNIVEKRPMLNLENQDESNSCPDGQNYNKVLFKCVVSCEDNLVYNGYVDSCTTEFELKYHGFCNEGFTYQTLEHTCLAENTPDDGSYLEHIPLKDPPRTTPPEPVPSKCKSGPAPSDEYYFDESTCKWKK